MIHWSRHLPVLTVFLVVTLLHVWMWRTLVAGSRVRRSRVRTVSVCLGVLLSVALIAIGVSLEFARVLATLPAGRWIAWTRAAALSWALFSLCLALFFWLRRLAPEFDPSRRKLLRAAGGSVLAAPALVGGGGVVGCSVVTGGGGVPAGGWTAAGSVVAGALGSAGGVVGAGVGFTCSSR